jgi:hypothetical protein
MLEAGSSLGGVLLGAALLPLTLLSRVAPQLAVGSVIGVGVLVEIALLHSGWRRWLPQRHCQVVRSLASSLSLPRAAFKWGLDLGLGLCTLPVTPALYAFLAVLSIQRSAWVTLMGGLVYGSVRGAAIALASAIAGEAGLLKMRAGRLKRISTAPMMVFVVGATASSVFALLR